MEDGLKAVVFELPSPEDMEEGRWEQILGDLHRLLADRKFPKIHLKSESESIKKMPQSMNCRLISGRRMP